MAKFCNLPKIYQNILLQDVEFEEHGQEECVTEVIQVLKKQPLQQRDISRVGFQKMSDMVRTG